MSRPVTVTLPLRDIRQAEGLTLEEAAQKLGWDADILRLIEYRGSSVYSRLKSLSDLYQRPIELIATAATPRKNNLSD